MSSRRDVPVLIQETDALLTTAMMSDSLDEVGLRNQVLRDRLAPIVPGSRAFGRAMTVQFAPALVADETDPYRAAIDFIQSIEAGAVIVVATDNNNDTAYWGELFSAAAIGVGAVGVVTDGNVRDSAKIARLGFPTFSRSRRPIDFRARLQIVATAQPVMVSGVRIDQGDLIIADDDGVVVVPQPREQEVLARARARAVRESTVLDELLAGQSISSVWERNGVL